MRIKSLTELKTELAAAPADKRAAYLEANESTIKFWCHVREHAEIIQLAPGIDGHKTLEAIESIINKAREDREVLHEKWSAGNATVDTACIDLPASLDLLPWPIDPKLKPLALEMLDREHAVTRVSSKTTVVDVSDAELPMMAFEDFNKFHARHRIEVDREKEKTIPLTKVWQEHPARKTRDGIVCDFTTAGDVGNKLNVFRGFPEHSVPAKSCQKFLDFIREVICEGDDYHYRYVIAWLADIVQNPHRKSGVCLVLRSDAEGTGKSFFGKMIAELFGKHAYIANSPKELLGSFNAHMAYCLFCVCNEVLWGGDHATSDALKAKITEDVIGLERKGFDTVQLRNSTRYVLTSNNTLPVAAGEHSRRYFVLDVSTVKKGNKKYFAEIAAEMHDGGFAALMEMLQAHDLSAEALDEAGIDLWRAPLTKARSAVAYEGAPPVERFVMHAIATGGLDAECGGRIDFNEERPTRIIKKEFKEAARAFTGVRLRGDLDTALTKALKNLECGVRADLKMEDHASGRRVPAYDLPPLKVLREALVKKWGEGILEAAGFEGVTMDTNETPPTRAIGGLRLTHKGWSRQRSAMAALRGFKQRAAGKARERAENDRATAEAANEWLGRSAAPGARAAALH